MILRSGPSSFVHLVGLLLAVQGPLRAHGVKTFPEPDKLEEMRTYGEGAAKREEQKRQRTLAKHQHGPTRLAPENFTQVVHGRGKNAFVMFCKKEEPCHRVYDFWELGTLHKRSHKVVVGLVECFRQPEWRVLCDEHCGEQGDVHIKYFTRATGPEGQMYKDGRGLELMDQSIRMKLSEVCSANRTDLCGEKEEAYLEKQQVRSSKELLNELERLDGLDPETMSDDVAQWLSSRVNILESLVVRKEKPIPKKRPLTREEALERVDQIHQSARTGREEDAGRAKERVSDEQSGDGQPKSPQRSEL